MNGSTLIGLLAAAVVVAVVSMMITALIARRINRVKVVDVTWGVALTGMALTSAIVGEGPQHTAVEAPELGIAVLYGGHYATETFGVRALGAEVERVFGLPWSFIAAPTGL